MNRSIFYYLERAARYHVCVLLMIYGFGKLLGGQFYLRGKLPSEIAQIPLSEVGGFDLAWTFMGYSYVYILFIGVSQVIGAILLLFEKTKLLGVAILIPILLNIIVFDAVFFDTYGALASAMIYFVLLLTILFLNREKIVKAFYILVSYHKKTIKRSVSAKLKTVSIIIVIMGLIFGIEQFFVNLLGH